MTGLKVLISGASGLLGWKAYSYLSRDYETLGLYKTHAIDQISSNLVKCDITKESSISAILDEFKPDFILNCAAFTDIDSGEENKDLCRKVNVDALGPFLRYCEDYRARLVHISTDAFFSLPAGEQADESFIPNPVNYYGETKLLGEKLILESGVNSVIIRTNIFGWNIQSKYCLAEWILDGLLSSEERNLFEDVTFSPILTNRLVRAISGLLESDLAGIFHVAGSESISKFEFGKRIAKMFALSSDVIHKSQVSNVPLRATRSNNMGLDSKKFFKIFPNLETSVLQDLTEFRNEMIYMNPNWIGNNRLGKIRSMYSF